MKHDETLPSLLYVYLCLLKSCASLTAWTTTASPVAQQYPIPAKRHSSGWRLVVVVPQKTYVLGEKCQQQFLVTAGYCGQQRHGSKTYPQKWLLLYLLYFWKMTNSGALDDKYLKPSRSPGCRSSCFSDKYARAVLSTCRLNARESGSLWVRGKVPQRDSENSKIPASRAWFVQSFHEIPVG